MLPENRENRRFGVSQWPTFQTGPLAPLFLPETRGKRRFLRELVVHSPEWTTGSVDFAGNQEKTPILWEPVVHFLEWTTGSALFAGIQGKSSQVQNPV